MTTADEYKHFADECMNWAREAKSDADRKAFLDMARAWTIAAAKANGGRVPITQPDDTLAPMRRSRPSHLGATGTASLFSTYPIRLAPQMEVGRCATNAMNSTERSSATEN
jgi:hypothetical protein